jgi:hypothetical protein
MDDDRGIEHDNGRGIERWGTWLRWSRVAIGVLGLLLIVIEYSAARSDANHASDLDASAIQIVQVWTPHLFYITAIIGGVVAAYVITRALD